MKILFLSPSGQLGGAERCLLDLLASLHAAEPAWALTVLAGEDGPLLDEVRRLGVAAQHLPFPQRLANLGVSHTTQIGLAWNLCLALPHVVLYRLRLHHAMRHIAPDLIHSNGLKMHLLAAWDSRAPVVWHLHDYVSRCASVARLLRSASRRCSGAIAISKSIAADARRGLRPGLPIEMIGNAVNLSRFQPEGLRTSFEKDSPPGTVFVGLIATFALWKGHDVFLRAFSHPTMRNLNFRAVIIGGPIYQTSQSQHSLSGLQTLARQLGVANRVTFTGFLADPAAAMRGLDIVVHASTAPEPFGLVIAEGMASGRAVIAAQSGGARELFTDKYDAWGVPPGDAPALAQAMAELIGNPERRYALGCAARITAERRFNSQRLGPALSAFYRGRLQTCEFSTSTAAISTVA